MLEYSTALREEELKSKVASNYFNNFDTTKIIGNIDFCISKKTKDIGLLENIDSLDDDRTQSFLWAESKRGNNQDIIESFIQLILTIGKAKTFEKYLPPIFLGAFDCEKIAFVRYNIISKIFVQNDFNWKVAPSNHETKEFKQIYNLIKNNLEKGSTLFNYTEDNDELKKFIKDNFILGKQKTERISITKNNFTTVYLKWLQKVKPSIEINWDEAKKIGILDTDFYLADLLSKNGDTIKESLSILLKHNKYEFNRTKNNIGSISIETTSFNDNQKAYTMFWSFYARPPRKEFWDYILKRRDLLVPQDIREQKGDYFTPQQWVELSQKYLSDTLGENWQEEYYIWDCCAGTGNLLAGLTNKFNIWASTFYKADVDVMKDRIDNGANLLKSHIFQMDFLNDNFKDKCPKELLEIINDSLKRKKLVIYINPPYVECGLAKNGKGKKDVQDTITKTKYKELLGKVSREIYAQFFIRIYKEVPDCCLAEFSKTKILQSPNFQDFRNNFKAKLEKLFLVPANTFDNVRGEFPIGFHIWDTSKKEIFKSIVADVYEDDVYNPIQQKTITSYDNVKFINDRLKEYKDNDGECIGWLNAKCNDFEHQKRIVIGNKNCLSVGDIPMKITKNNIIQIAIYFSARFCISAN